MKKYPGLIIVLCLPLFVFPQVYTGQSARKFISGSEIVRYTSESTNPEYIRYRPDVQPLFTDLNAWMAQTFKTSAAMSFVLTGTEKDKMGNTHYRYCQTYKGIPVHEAVFIVHVSDGKIQSFNGTVFSSMDVSDAFSLSPETALIHAKAFVNAQEYKWERANEELWLKKISGNPDASYFPEAKKEITFCTKDSLFHTCYKFDIYASKPLSRQNVYVDAASGKIIKSLETLHTTDVTGTAVTKYSGTRMITTDSVSPGSFRLRETGRGDGIYTYNMQQQTDYNAAVDFTDADNYWNNVNLQYDEAATDAHWGSEMTYDYFMLNHGRNSIDGNGFALYSYVHYDQAYNNAFWDGQCMTYGDGDGTDYFPFTALDICGHEITHGLDEFTANLDYSDESGALNEGFSDIFGTAIEFYGKPSMANWTCGEDIGVVLRNIQDPNLTENPDTYLGLHWDIFQEVHQNSTVLSHWHYLVSQGGSGTNDNNDAYSVTGIGMDKASDVAFRMLTIYLTPTSDYMDARFYAIVSASDLYGYCSPEVASVTNAMYAVGLGDAYQPVPDIDFTALNTITCSTPHTVYFENYTINASNFLWNFGDGTTSSLMNPSHTYNATGTYDVSLKASSSVCGTDSLVQTGFVSIASTNSNYAVIPEHETGQTLTCCTGTLFDSGETGDYANNTDGMITIAPAGASSVVLDFSSFSFESGYDYLYIYDGPSTSSPLIGQYDGNSLPNGGTIQSTYGTITLRQTTDVGLTEPGFELTWHCNLPTAPPIPNFSASEVQTCTGVIHFYDMSFNGPLTWHWDFGDGDTSNLQNPVHAYQANGTYTVSLTTGNNFGDSTKTVTGYIVVQNLPAPPSVIPGYVCDSGSVTLTASGSGGQLNWYQTQTGDSLLHTGSTFITPFLDTTTIFYVEQADSTPLEYVGKYEKSADATLHNNNNYYLIFDCYTPLILKSVKVYAGDNKDRIIQLRDSTGNVLQSLTASVPANESRVILNFNVPAGNNLKLTCGTEDPNLYRDQSNINFPYTLPGKISITGTNAPSLRYYYFYDWEVQVRPCISPRVSVEATVADCSGIGDREDITSFKVYPSPAEHEFYIEFNGQNKEAYLLTIYDLIGKSLLSQKISATGGINRYRVDCSIFESGLYIIDFRGTSSNHQQKIIVR